MADENDRGARLSDLNALEQRTQDSLAELRTMITEEGANTRRYFDMMVERMSELMKPIADGVAHHSRVLDDHESRLQQIENPR
jgi:hypothetical protein